MRVHIFLFFLPFHCRPRASSSSFLSSNISFSHCISHFLTLTFPVESTHITPKHIPTANSSVINSKICLLWNCARFYLRSDLCSCSVSPGCCFSFFFLFEMFIFKTYTFSHSRPPYLSYCFLLHPLPTSNSANFPTPLFLKKKN